MEKLINLQKERKRKENLKIKTLLRIERKIITRKVCQLKRIAIFIE